jgi:hypothetical protein
VAALAVAAGRDMLAGLAGRRGHDRSGEGRTSPHRATELLRPGPCATHAGGPQAE